VRDTRLGRLALRAASGLEGCRNPPNRESKSAEGIYLLDVGTRCRTAGYLSRGAPT